MHDLMRILKLTGREARKAACIAVMAAPDGWMVKVSEPTRSLEQNARLWPMLNDIASQVVWHGTKLIDEEWKDIFSAALKRAKVVPGLDGGFVVLGQRTSNMSKSEFSELIELMFSFGAEHEVVWSDPMERAA